MGEVFFYHLTRSPVEQTLPMLLGRALQAGWRVVVRGTSPERLHWLDEQLWLSPPDGFMPHGLAGGPHDAHQPVLLTTGPTRPNAAACVICLDGALLDPTEARGLQRGMVLFDGLDEAALTSARNQWKALTEAGVGAQYWSEDAGRWQKKAERAAADSI